MAAKITEFYKNNCLTRFFKNKILRTMMIDKLDRFRKFWTDVPLFFFFK